MYPRVCFLRALTGVCSLVKVTNAWCWFEDQAAVELIQSLSLSTYVVSLHQSGSHSLIKYALHVQMYLLVFRNHRVRDAVLHIALQSP